jgi:hypothetical protein
MQYTRSDSGLILAEEIPDAASVERQLKQIDRGLSLQAWPRQDGPPIWRVVLHYAGDRPPETIASWIDQSGEPLPLSSRLVDLVRSLDKNSRVAYVDADGKNAQFEEQRERDNARDEEALIADWRMPHGRPVLPRSQSLRRSRDKQRAKGKKL